MFTPERLEAFFHSHPASSYLLAYSGGLDSHVLLHACARLRQTFPARRFRAIHIDHGLQTVSAQWAEHCRAACKALDFPLAVQSLNLKIPPGSSLERVAREARYAAFSAELQEDEILLTAHHQGDQAETVLLNLLRGSGVDGLAAMPECRPFAAGRLCRPLLGIARAELETYARQQGLVYVDDPSNAHTHFDRNYLRHEILPRLQQRWPGAGQTLARAARLQAEARSVLEILVRAKLPQIQGSRASTLSVSSLLKQDTPVQKALLRTWLEQQGFGKPEEKKLGHLLSDVLHARADAAPCVHWDGCEVRRYRDDVYAMPPLPPHDPAQVIPWTADQPLWIASLQRMLEPGMLGGWRKYLQDGTAPLSVRFRRGGEAVHIPYRKGHRSLKHLLQEAGVPPWERERLPLIYVGRQLAVIPGVLLLEPDSGLLQPDSGEKRA